jgi:hypothetical protein
MIYQPGIDTVKITALSNHKPGILSNYIRINLLFENFTASIGDLMVANIRLQAPLTRHQ